MFSQAICARCARLDLSCEYIHHKRGKWVANFTYPKPGLIVSEGQTDI